LDGGGVRVSSEDVEVVRGSIVKKELSNKSNKETKKIETLL